jgi:hypothetical protein
VTIICHTNDEPGSATSKYKFPKPVPITKNMETLRRNLSLYCGFCISFLPKYSINTVYIDDGISIDNKIPGIAIMKAIQKSDS